MTLIAVSGEPSAVEVSFVVPSLVPDAEVEDYDEDRRLRPSGDAAPR